jgi:hypothetical protein
MEHVSISGKLQVARYRHDGDAIRKLETLETKAGIARDASKREFLLHKASCAHAAMSASY